MAAILLAMKHSPHRTLSRDSKLVPQPLRIQVQSDSELKHENLQTRKAIAPRPGIH
ncbi:MAG: hypothetical protein WD601_10215 [Pseudohongiellaceae bacterium]